MIVVVPEGSHFAMSFLEHDQYKGTNLAASIIAMANVVEEEDLRRIMDLLLCPTSAHVPLCTGRQYGGREELDRGMACGLMRTSGRTRDVCWAVPAIIQGAR